MRARLELARVELELASLKRSAQEHAAQEGSMRQLASLREGTFDLMLAANASERWAVASNAVAVAGGAQQVAFDVLANSKEEEVKIRENLMTKHERSAREMQREGAACFGSEATSCGAQGWSGQGSSSSKVQSKEE